MKAQTLFDANLGTLPEAQGWTYLALGFASDSLMNNSALLDTTLLNDTHAGWTEIAPIDLNRTNGFALHFTVRVDVETHSSTNRAGFSIIVLNDDAHGLELGFWNNSIFVQSDNPLFTHGEDAAFSTTNTFVDYSLNFSATSYVLKANGVTILTGLVRDYTAYNGQFNVYSTPNFLFLGDDTGSASGQVELRNVTLIPAPKLTIDSTGVVTWTGISNQLYLIQAASDLMNWSTGVEVASATSTFSYTNNPNQSSQFYRVIVP